MADIYHCVVLLKEDVRCLSGADRAGKTSRGYVTLYPFRRKKNRLSHRALMPLASYTCFCKQ